jgi:hypothetical protein
MRSYDARSLQAALALLDGTVKLSDAHSHLECRRWPFFRRPSARISPQLSCRSPRLALPPRIKFAYRQTRALSKRCVEICHAHDVFCHTSAIRFFFRTIREGSGRGRDERSRSAKVRCLETGLCWPFAALCKQHAPPESRRVPIGSRRPRLCGNAEIISIHAARASTRAFGNSCMAQFADGEPLEGSKAL